MKHILPIFSLLLLLLLNMATSELEEAFLPVIPAHAHDGIAEARSQKQLQEASDRQKVEKKSKGLETADDGMDLFRRLKRFYKK